VIAVERLDTVDDVAALLNCSKDHIYKLVRSGELSAVRHGPKFLRFRPEDVDSYIRAHLDYASVAAVIERGAP
jgi:excisionase family DNA binding protein